MLAAQIFTAAEAVSTISQDCQTTVRFQAPISFLIAVKVTCAKSFHFSENTRLSHPLIVLKGALKIFSRSD
jgi:hypothetical protein